MLMLDSSAITATISPNQQSHGGINRNAKDGTETPASSRPRVAVWPNPPVLNARSEATRIAPRSLATAGCDKVQVARDDIPMNIKRLLVGGEGDDQREGN